MRMDQLIESIEEALSDQDKNKLDYLRKREKAGLIKPDQKGELRKLDRIAKSAATKSAASSWGVPSAPPAAGAGQGSRKQDKQNLKSWLPKAGDKSPDRPKPKTLLGKLGRKLTDFASSLAGAR